MISVVFATIAFLIVFEGILIAFFPVTMKKAMKEIVKRKDSQKIIRKIGLWEIIIGFLLLIAAILIRNM